MARKKSNETLDTKKVNKVPSKYKKNEKINITIAGKCAPSAFDNYKSTLSCLSANELITIAALYNKDIEKKEERLQMKDFANTKKLVEFLNKRFSNVCRPNDDYCWINQPSIKSSDLYQKIKKNYRPEKPSSWKYNKTTWLNTYDILNVMNQYSEKYQNYKFLGVFPIDFMDTYNNSSVCIRPNICGFHINDLIKENKTEFGIILNLDKHDQPGSHWVSIFGSIDPKSKKFGLIYYDSLTIKPTNYILKFCEIFKKQVNETFDKKISNKMILQFNKIKHQFKNTECGMYAMIFNILCIENKNETYVKTLCRIDTGSDDLINEYRDKLYASFEKRT